MIDPIDQELGFEPIGSLGLSTAEWANAMNDVRHLLDG